MTYLDLGDVWSHRFTVKVGGTLTNATVSLTVYKPDGSSVSPSLTNTSTGLYDVAYTTTVQGWHRWVLSVSGAAEGKDSGGFTVADPAEAPLVSLDMAKGYLNVSASATSDDDELRRMLGVATDLCERYTGRALRRKTVTESFASDGYAPVLVLRQVPALSVSSVSENGTAVASGGYTLRGDLGLLARGSATAPSRWAFGTVAVTYVAGYSMPPESAQEAVLVTLADMWETQRGNMAGLPGLGGDGDVFAPTGRGYALPRRAAQLLDPLRVAAIG